jgi:signal transduction histidine kinase
VARLLIVDDVPDNVALMVSCLQPLGHELITAHDGLTALKLAEQSPPDLALLDLMMPGLDGVEVARLLQRRPATRNVPVVLVTARGETSERLRALEAGILEVLTKPFEPAELVARVASVLRLKLLNDQLARAKEELLRRESLSAIGTLVAGVAHEVNNPLGSALSILQMVREQARDAGFGPDLDFAIDQLERVKRLVASLLGLSRQTNDFEESLSLERVAADAARVVSSQVSGVRIDMRAEPGLPTLRGNYAQLGQVAVNFLMNAAQAARPGAGLVELDVGRGEGARAGQLFLRAGDNGPGVSDSVRPMLFQPFFTTKPPGQGTGLGLYACRMIAEKHRATIEVGTSRLGGASFTLWIPSP